jgi:hypothetical protein
VQLALARHLLGQLLAERHLLLDGVEVQAPADVAVADLAGIILPVGSIAGRDGQETRQDDRGEESHGDRSFGFFPVL